MLKPDISNIIKSMGKLFGLMNLYHYEHPAVEQALSDTMSRIHLYLSEHADLTIGTAEQKLVVGDIPIEKIGLVGAEVVEIFDKGGIDSITISKGVSKEEIRLLCRAILSGEPDIEGVLAKEGGFHVRVNSVHYTRIKDGEVVATESGEENTEWIGLLQGDSLDSMIWKVIVRAVKSPEDQKRVFSMIMKQLEKDIEEKVKIATMELQMEKRQIAYDKERSEMILSHVADGLVMVDDRGRILMMNETAERIFGKRLKEQAGRRITEGIGEEHMVALSKDLSSVMKEGLEKEMELEGMDETRRILKSSTALVHNREGKVVGMISVLSDITRQKELDRLKKDFVSHVTHELRTPLVAMKQAVTLIVDRTAGTINEQQEKMLQIVKRNVERLSKFINDLLDIQKIEAGRLVIHWEATDLRPLVDDVVQSLTPWAESQGIDLASALPDDLPEVYADADRVTQILTNLAGNAIKFTAKGGKVTIKASPPAGRDEMGHFLKVAVMDTGRGIAREDIDRIFEKFEQAGGKEATDIKGSGLGLSIVKSLVEMQGGKIWVESQLNVGSKFTFTLPVYSSSSDDDRKTEDKNAAPGKKRGLLQRIGLIHQA